MKIKINTQLRVVTFKLDEDLLQNLDLYAVNVTTLNCVFIFIFIFTPILCITKLGTQESNGNSRADEQGKARIRFQKSDTTFKKKRV